MKRCPFCKSEDIEVYLYDGYKTFVCYAYCKDCGAQGPKVDIHLREQFKMVAHELWEKRK
jgi:hypothetical protein